MTTLVSHNYRTAPTRMYGKSKEDSCPYLDKSMHLLIFHVLAPLHIQGRCGPADFGPKNLASSPPDCCDSLNLASSISVP